MSDEATTDEGGSLRRLAGRSAILVLSIQVGVQVISLVRIALVGRALPPAEFGIFGVALLLIGILETFTNPGIQGSLIQRQGKIDRYLNAMWTLAVLRAFGVGLLVFLLAVPAALFFRSPESATIIRLLAVVVALRGLNSLGPLLNTKQLAFGKNVTSLVLPNGVELIVAVALAYQTHRADALMWAYVSHNLVKLGLSYLVHPFRPRFDFRLSVLRELVGYGRWVTANKALLYLLQNIDDVIVGRLLGPFALGAYQVSYRFSNLPATQLSSTVFKVTFPLYSKVQHDPARLGHAFGSVFRYMAALIFIATAYIVAFAPDFVRIVLGSRWQEAAILMQILGIYGLWRAITGLAGPLMLAIGRPDLQTKHGVVDLVILVATFWPAVHFGGLIVGTWALTGLSALFGIAFFASAATLVPLPWWDLARSWFAASGAGFAILATSFALHRAVGTPDLAEVLLFVLCCGVAGVLALLIVDRAFGGHFVADLRRSWQALRAERAPARSLVTAEALEPPSGGAG